LDAALVVRVAQRGGGRRGVGGVRAGAQSGPRRQGDNRPNECPEGTHVWLLLRSIAYLRCVRSVAKRCPMPPDVGSTRLMYPPASVPVGARSAPWCTDRNALIA